MVHRPSTFDAQGFKDKGLVSRIWKCLHRHGSLDALIISQESVY